MTKKIITSALLIFAVISNGFAGTDPLAKNNKLLFEKKQTQRSGEYDNVFGVGVQMSNLKLLGSGFKGLTGFGLNAMYASGGERNAFFGDFNFYLPTSRTTTGYGYAFSSGTNPSQIDIDVTTKISGMGFRFGFRRYLIKDISEEGFKMYIQAVAGLLLFKGENTMASYDESKYYTMTESTSTATGFTIGGGLGLEYSIASKINIFAEVNLNVPANQVNGSAVDVEIPLSFQSVIGVRYHF